MKIGTLFRTIFLVALALALLSGSAAVTSGDTVESVRRYTRPLEFDYVTWMLRALGQKIMQSSVQSPAYIAPDTQKRVVESQISLVAEIDQVNAIIEQIYSDPQISEPAQAAKTYNQQLDALRGVQGKLQPVSEAVIQDQVSQVLAENGLTLGGQPIPPVLFHTTPLPMALIISPRGVIQQDANISLVADLTTPQAVELEKRVEENLNVSALVVPVGGVGVYPTMVMSTTDLPWLLEVVAHEWTHNYLTLRPLGMNYETNGALRTMNETTASIAGNEIGAEVLRRFYPERAPQPVETLAPTQTPSATATQTPTPEVTATPAGTPTPKPFDFRAEMHEIRITVDQMLADGKIEQAEQYMEMRRRFLWEHGYQIRRLNQAYFAFYGAYADVPGGPAGKDPVGPAVRALRAQSPSLADFLNRIAWMTSFEELQQAVKAAN